MLVEFKFDQGGMVAGLVNPRQGQRADIDGPHALDLIRCGVAVPVVEAEPIETADLAAPEKRAPGRPRKDEGK